MPVLGQYKRYMILVLLCAAAGVMLMAGGERGVIAYIKPISG